MNKAMSRVADIRAKRRNRRRLHVRTKVKGSAECPRLTVQKSLRHVYAQLVDDVAGKSLAQVSSINFSFDGGEGKPHKTAQSEQIGRVLAEKAREIGVTEVVFDRNHNLYHGRIKAVAESARKAGLKF